MSQTPSNFGDSSLPAKRVTMKDVAKVAGVSAMTVSCALKNSPRVLPATREKILDAVRQLGYRPDPEISKLMAHLRQPTQLSFSHNLSFINSWPDPQEHLKGYVGKIYQGASHRAAELGFDLEPFWLLERGMTEQRLSDILYNRGIRGVLLAPLPDPLAEIRFEWERFSVVASSLSITRPALNRVAPHVFKNTLLACDELLKLGYKRIGYIETYDWHLRSEALARGAFEMVRATRLQADSPPVLTLQGNDDHVLIDWFKTHRPDAILSPSALPYYKLLKTMRKGAHLGFIVLDSLQNDHLTGVDQNPGNLGAASVDLLVSQILHNETGIPEIPKLMLLDGYLRPGNSTRRVAKKIEKERHRDGGMVEL